MREQITFYKDQYEFYKELKSKRLLVAFMEYMFEDIEPEGLNGIEKVAFNSLKIRMDNQKKKSYAGKQSSGGGRPGNTNGELDHENNTTNNTKTTEQTTEKQEDNNTNVLLLSNTSKDVLKKKYLDFVYLSDEEYNKLIDAYGERVIKEQIENLNNYIGQKGKDKYKSHYYTILRWNRKAGIKELPKRKENESGIYDLPF